MDPRYGLGPEHQSIWGKGGRRTLYYMQYPGPIQCYLSIPWIGQHGLGEYGWHHVELVTLIYKSYRLIFLTAGT